MNQDVVKEVAALRRTSNKDLQRRYAELFGETSRTKNRSWLVKRIAWRLQAQAEGDLSDRARRRAVELANEADLRLSPPKIPAVSVPAGRTATGALAGRINDRLPPAGTLLTRIYKGQALQVQVLDHGFEFEGQVYKSLSAVAKAITGSHCNGFAFFRLGQEVGP